MEVTIIRLKIASFAKERNSMQHNENLKESIYSFVLRRASDHLINSDALYPSSTVLNPPIKICAVTIGTFITATKKEIINATSNTGILGIPYYLLSVGKMQQAKMCIVFNPIGVENSRNGKIIITG